MELTSVKSTHLTEFSQEPAPTADARRWGSNGPLIGLPRT